MSHFAQVDENNIVLRVLVIEQNEVESGNWGLPERWIQTSYTGSIRKNFAGIGFTYDKKLDAFIPPSPGEGWTLNKKTCQWKPPAEPAQEPA